MRLPHALRGWWRYSTLVGWRLSATAAVAAYSWLAAAGLAVPRGRAGLLLAVVFSALAVAQLGYGAVHAERARRYGCW